MGRGCVRGVGGGRGVRVYAFGVRAETEEMGRVTARPRTTQCVCVCVGWGGGGVGGGGGEQCVVCGVPCVRAGCEPAGWVCVCLGSGCVCARCAGGVCVRVCVWCVGCSCGWFGQRQRQRVAARQRTTQWVCGMGMVCVGVGVGAVLRVVRVVCVVGGQRQIESGKGSRAWMDIPHHLLVFSELVQHL